MNMHFHRRFIHAIAVAAGVLLWFLVESVALFRARFRTGPGRLR